MDVSHNKNLDVMEYIPDQPMYTTKLVLDELPQFHRMLSPAAQRIHDNQITDTAIVVDDVVLYTMYMGVVVRVSMAQEMTNPSAIRDAFRATLQPFADAVNFLVARGDIPENGGTLLRCSAFPLYVDSLSYRWCIALFMTAKAGMSVEDLNAELVAHGYRPYFTYEGTLPAE